MYVPSTRKIISSYDFLNGSFSIDLAYTSQPYSEAMAMRPSATYTLCATSPREQTGDIITFKFFEERIFYLKLVTMQKTVRNPTTIQSCHQCLVKKKLMPWILEIIQMMTLSLRRC